MNQPENPPTNDGTNCGNRAGIGNALPGDSVIIHRYTRQQAIEDGVLVDLTEWAKEAGFPIPVACTAAVYHQYLQPPPGTESEGQSLRGRAHDLLFMLFVAILQQPEASDQLMFKVIFLNAKRQQETVQLKSVCGPGDSAEPVLTILLPDED